MIDAQTKSVGAADIGGSFELTDHNGKRFSSESLEGEFSILYFGFTQCPDVCPDELDKITETVKCIGNRYQWIRDLTRVVMLEQRSELELGCKRFSSLWILKEMMLNL